MLARPKNGEVKTPFTASRIRAIEKIVETDVDRQIAPAIAGLLADNESAADIQVNRDGRRICSRIARQVAVCYIRREQAELRLNRPRICKIRETRTVVKIAVAVVVSAGGDIKRSPGSGVQKYGGTNFSG